jgi:predicted TPR repeat methyltransferase
MDDAARYHLPVGYVPNRDVRAALAPYWTPERIELSARYQLAVYEAARSFAIDRGVRTVIDVGCGTAVKLNRLFDARFDIVGVDIAEAVRVARDLHRRGHYVAADLDDPALDLTALVPPLPGPRLVICADVIEHLLRPEHLLAAIRTFAADRDTRVVISTPDRIKFAGPDANRPSVPEHVREWSSSELRRFLEDSGFVVISQALEMPFRLGADRMTARYVARQLRRRLPLRSNQRVLCRVAT